MSSSDTPPSLRSPEALSPDEILDELAAYLRPPGQGIHTVTTGKLELARKTAQYLGSDDPDLAAGWRGHVALALEAPVALLSIPSDTGAGIVRGAARGPEAIREALGRAPVPELGDVFCIPHLLDEDMLSSTQRVASQAAIYPNLAKETRAAMPVSPLGMARRVYALARAANPQLRIMMLGGDHTVSCAPMEVLLDADPQQNQDVGVVHFDAHTDLLPERLGVKNCFATWAFHANQRLGAGERLLQLGIRASGRERGHWEKTQGVRQIWAKEARELSPEALASLVLEHLDRRGLTRIYLSNDIDGTDAHWAAACGTPEGEGLHPDQVSAVIDALGAAKGLRFIGADLVEVAPGLSLDAAASARTVDTAARYTRDTLKMLGADLGFATKAE